VWVTALVVLLPYIKRLQGQQTALLPPTFALPAAFSCPKPQGRREYMRVQVQAGQLVAHPNQSSGVLSSAVWADGFAIIDSGMTVQQGDVVPFLPFSGLMV
jgi:molybdopterin molybdotransferase